MNERPRHTAATEAISAGRIANDRALSTPIWTSAVWEAPDADEAARQATSVRPERFYSRYGNPTVRAFEDAVAALERAEAALAFGSGMGALSTVLFALCSAGDHVVASRNCYAGTKALLDGPAARLGISTTWVDATRPGAISEAVESGRTMLVIAETPSNPLLDLVDLDELGSITGPFTVVDSTFATPLGQAFGIAKAIWKHRRQYDGCCDHITSERPSPYFVDTRNKAFPHMIHCAFSTMRSHSASQERRAKSLPMASEASANTSRWRSPAGPRLLSNAR